MLTSSWLRSRPIKLWNSECVRRSRSARTFFVPSNSVWRARPIQRAAVGAVHAVREPDLIGGEDHR